MDIVARIRDLFRSKTEVVDVDPWVSPTAVESPAAVVGNPWKPAPQRQAPAPKAPENVWVQPTQGVKVRVLRAAAKLLIVLNLVIGVFFYSTSWTLNASLWGYLGIVTVILAHYLSVSR